MNGRQVGRLTGARVRVLSIDDPNLHAQLNREPAVRALLDSQEGRAALAGPSRRAPRLDEAAVRLSSPFGRDLSRACSLAIWDRIPRPDGIHHRSRHDDDEHCWALFDHADVRLIDAVPFAPESNGVHRQTLQEVAAMWDIPLPPAWT